MRKAPPALLIVLAITLGACSSTAAVETQSPTAIVAETLGPSGGDTSGAASLSTPNENALPIVSQLLVGTLALEGTDQAVTAEQAAVLLPLWTEYSGLNRSTRPAVGQSGTATDGTDVQAQIDALVAEIQAAMTSEQIKAIADLQLTFESAQTMLSDLGISMADMGQGTGGQQPPTTPGADGQQPQGEPPSGSPPSDGQQPLGTPMAGGPEGGQGSGAPGMGGSGSVLPPGTTSTLILLLQERSGAPTSTP